MRDFTDSLFEGLVDNNIKSLDNVPGATRLLNDIAARISLLLYDEFNQVNILPESGQIADNVWEYTLVFNKYEKLPTFMTFLNKLNVYLTNYYKTHGYSQIIPVDGVDANNNEVCTRWQLLPKASSKATTQFNNVQNFIENKKVYLNNMIKKVVNGAKTTIEIFTTTPSTYTTNEFNLSFSIKIDLAAFESAINICQELNTDNSKEILLYFIANKNKYFSTSGILEYINKYTQNNYGKYFKNGVAAFQYLINALNQEIDLVAANPDKIIPFKSDSLGKLLPRKLVTSDPDLKLQLGENKLTADAKIYGENSDSRFNTNHVSDYLLTTQLGADPRWLIYTKADNYKVDYSPSDIQLFVDNGLIFPNITLLKFKAENYRTISATKLTDDQLPKFIYVEVNDLEIKETL